MTSTTHDKEWIIEDKIISMMALCDNEKRLLGMDTDLGHQDVMRKAIRNELDQIRREAVEEHNKKGSWELTAQSVKEIELEAKKELLDLMYEQYFGFQNREDGSTQFMTITWEMWEELRAQTLGEK